jgi:competence ComEA-like helix-hairpin-helix protein
MQVCEGQRLGALSILIASLAVYGVLFISDYRSLKELSLPWGDQKPEMIAVEVTDPRGGEGIYFLPQGTKFSEIMKATGIWGRIRQSGHGDTRFFDSFAIAVSAQRKVLEIKEMEALRRLSLGLKIDVNRASAEELSRVPGIGEKMAARIVHIRQAKGKFDTLWDLTAVPGIKEKKLNDLKKYLLTS